MVVHRAESDSLTFGDLIERVRLLRVQREWLLHNRVATCLEHFLRDREMSLGRRDHVNDVRCTFMQQVMNRTEDSLNAVLGRALARTGEVGVCNADDAGA